MNIGIDLGVRSIHIASLTNAFTIEAKKDVRQNEIRFLFDEFSKWVDRVYEELHGAVSCTFFIEEPVVAGARNLRSSLQIAQVAGAIMAAPIDSYLVPVSSWKKEVVGKGNANKEQVSEWLKDNHPYLYSITGGKQDFVDATCIRLYGDIVESRILTA